MRPHPTVAACTPSWWPQICPYGRDVYEIPFVAATLPSPEHRSPAMVMAFVISLWPPFMVAILSGKFLWRRGVKEFLLLLFLLVDYLTTQALKHHFQEPRPEGSCLVDCGMPSGHSSAAFCILAWGFLYEIQKGGLCAPTIQVSLKIVGNIMFLITIFAVIAMLVDGSYANANLGTITQQFRPEIFFEIFFIVFAQTVLCCGPMELAFTFVAVLTPMAREILWDHSRDQVVYGMAKGAALGAGFWLVLYSTPLAQSLTRVLKCLTDNYTPQKPLRGLSDGNPQEDGTELTNPQLRQLLLAKGGGKGTPGGVGDGPLMRMAKGQGKGLPTLQEQQPGTRGPPRYVPADSAGLAEVRSRPAPVQEGAGLGV